MADAKSGRETVSAERTLVRVLVFVVERFADIVTAECGSEV